MVRKEDRALSSLTAQPEKHTSRGVLLLYLLPDPFITPFITASFLHTLAKMSTPPATKSVASENLISKKVRRTIESSRTALMTT